MKYLKKCVFVLLMLLSLFYIKGNVYASSGSIKQSSVIKCNGKYYGAHGNPMHFHLVEKNSDNKWVSISDEVEAPSCYLEKENEKIEVTLSKCIDGDTAKFITKDGEIKTTRFLAIDTPESVHPTKEVESYGKEASNFTCKLLTNAKKIVLEFDKNSDKEDKYGRLLAFVYADNKMVQESLIENGYAKVAYLYADYTHTEYLKGIEQKAKEKQIGIWGNDISSIMDEESLGDTSQEEINSNNKKSNKKNSNNDEIWDLIWEIIKKIVSKLFNYLESVL